MKSERTSQKTYILSHLRKYGTIEPMTALRKYGVYRLGARISDLREDGFDIRTERTEGVSHLTGNRVSYALYRLIEPKGDGVQP